MMCLASAAALPQDIGVGLTAALREAWSGRDVHDLWRMFIETCPSVLLAVAVAVTAAMAVTGSRG